MKILVLTSRFPYPIEKGDKLRIYRQIRGLSARHDVVLCSLTEQRILEDDYAKLKQYCSEIYTFRLRKNHIALNLAKGFLNGLPMQVAYFYKRNFHRSIYGIIQKEKPDVVYCQLARMAEYARDLPLPNVVDYMDAFSVNAKRWSENAPLYLRPFLAREARKMMQYEVDIFADFDAHTIISTQDRNHLNINTKERIKIIPNGVDFDFFQSKKEKKPSYDLVFVGNMGYAPNVEATRFLVQEILPKLQHEIPTLRLLIAGARPAPEVLRLQSEQVTVTGWVDDIRDAYDDGGIFVAPLFMGAGLQNKILEAMAMGVPCVTTSMVNNAIGAKADTSIMLADNADEFAEKIIQLSKDETLRKKLSYEGLVYIQDNFAWGAFVRDLEQIFEGVIEW